MPIIGVTDKKTVSRGGYALIGRLYKGSEKPKDRPGRDQPWFRFVGINERVQVAWDTLFPEKPTELRAFLPYQSADRNFSSWIERWKGSRMLWRADGVRTVRRWCDDLKAYSDKLEDQLLMSELPDLAMAQWKGRLNLFFVEMAEVGYPGVVMLGTSGKHDIPRLATALHQIEKDCAGVGLEGMKGVEVCIFRREVVHAAPDGKTRGHHDVFLMPSTRWVQAQLAKAEEALIELLPSGNVVIDGQTGEVLTSGSQPVERIKDAKASEHVEAPPPVQPKKVSRRKTRSPRKKKVASISGCSTWGDKAKELADQYPAYVLENGSPAYPLMLERAMSKGFEKVTNENVDDVIAALVSYVQPDDPVENGGSDTPPEVVEQDEIPF